MMYLKNTVHSVLLKTPYFLFKHVAICFQKNSINCNNKKYERLLKLVNTYCVSTATAQKIVIYNSEFVAK